jgi:serine/threonine-protein kinase
MADTLTAGQAKGGYREAMRAGAGKLAARQAETYVLSLQVAMLHAYAGDKSQALDWLERAFDQRESGLVKLQIDPDWDTLRDEPRFQALLRRMNFPPS